MSGGSSDGLKIDGLETQNNTNEQLATPALSPIAEHGLNDISDQHESTSLFDNDAFKVSTSTPRQSSGGRRKRTINGEFRTPDLGLNDEPRILKLSPAQIYELTSSPGSVPLRSASPIFQDISVLSESDTAPENVKSAPLNASETLFTPPMKVSTDGGFNTPQHVSESFPSLSSARDTPETVSRVRPGSISRSTSSPVVQRRQSSTAPRRPTSGNDGSRAHRPSLTVKVGESKKDLGSALRPSSTREPTPSPMPAVIPLPPLSLPTYLQLELSSDRPSALYIHRPINSEFPYESSKVKYERLLNFLYLPHQLEQVLLFGALACLDAWLYTFTILPLRFTKAVLLLFQWWAQSLLREVYDVSRFVYTGIGRLWMRAQQDSNRDSRRPSVVEGEQAAPKPADPVSPTPPGLDTGDSQSPSKHASRRRTSANRHKRTKSTPSVLLPNHKADILHGLLIAISCMILVRFDASRMYHSIRGQAAIKLYVIYNVLEVGDRLFSALGQDILECLFSKETLERNPNGRSKVIRPFWMFVLALVYNVTHATMLFYQAVTLNVAVNSYSNALLTLLMSNQFVEIKGTVFKKFEKENLFQITCADIVERFQLWLMLLVIALRNIVEVGGLSIGSFTSGSSSSTSSFSPNATGTTSQSTSILPQAFTILPKFTGQVLGPFLIVLGSEMLVDWLKHAYINKFNSVKPSIYGRFLDVLAKDYYSHAFADQNLTKRLGLPVLPLSCLFIRASVQTYHMLLATHMPLPMASTATSLSVESAAETSSSPTTAALQQIDMVFRRALGRSSFGAGAASSGVFTWSLDDLIALSTMVLFFLLLYLILLAFKLVLGMVLLSFARSRYKGMKEREKAVYDTNSRRVGGWGIVEVDEDKRRWIYEDDEEGLKALRDREAKAKEKAARTGDATKLDGIDRYMMAAKRIW